MGLGTRLFYNQNGEILCTFSEIQEGGYRLNADQVFCIDLPFGYADWSMNIISHVDVTTGTPVLMPKPPRMTEEQRRIRELEDALLLQADAEVGGIL